MLLLVVLHNVVQVDELAGLDVSGSMGLEGPVSRKVIG